MLKRQLGPCVTYFPQPTSIITSVNSEGTANLMTASWVGIVSKTPPTMAISLNKGRQTYDNISKQKEFVVNMVPASLAVEADFCGIRSGKNHDKLEQAGLSLQPAECVKVPLLNESPLNVECRLVQEVELGDYRLLMGEILQIHAAESAFDEAGKMDVRCFDPLVYLGGVREYWDLGNMRAAAYADGQRLVVDK
ncbi:NADH-FMN oxidoreductase RutF, flavin reductase (DIM6/NTAB) family [Malonomonas rubra DSM 5091]|uniref:NADH-FMN oxidoreductase RutF, flavin reductase (DIM6/NTAB) family n=1 Tax=Malonomonas rubra DSM 5091 TaxID=1122189 RepID=A0A1M6B2C0_MALRU|nr:flavin reductase family protein [Malonomonas rubra]SHI42892.1 NADH-FMN oxidoreductase RutF, flavin reductase (DIM6/NTAB) family [Malonomonas rubra DSM 5091]